MKRILITGATGNIGREVIRFMFLNHTSDKVIAGVRNVEKAKKEFGEFPLLEFMQFDFENTTSFDNAFENIESVFLLRPPHIADVERYFKPLILKMRANNVKEILFLSVQGVEKSKVIPHNKIEKLITNSGLNYIFLRPSYFMQNLTTTLHKDIKEKRSIILPAGNAKFNWVDVENIGETAAILLGKFNDYKNQAFEITGYENKSFAEVVVLINEYITASIQYISPNPIRYYLIKKHDGLERGMILVMIMLHFLPRFQKPPYISHIYEQITGKKPTSLTDFIKREKEAFKL